MTEFRVPREKAAPTGPGAGPWHTAANIAGFFGALPFGLLTFFLLIEWKDPQGSTSEYLFVGLLCTLSLVPFAVAMSGAGRDAWSRALVLVIPALLIGSVAIVLYPLGLIVYPVAFGLGLLLGLAALGPCWRRGDAEGRALALLGMTPALWLLGAYAANWVWHHGDRDVDASAPVGPSGALPPTGSDRGLTAAPDPSWLLRWEYLLALVAVGLAVGALRLLLLRRRRATTTGLRGLDAAGAGASREGDSPGREIPSLDVAPGVAGPPRHDEASQRGILAALRRVPARLAEASTNRLAVAVLGCSLGGGMVGSLTGAVAGSLLIGLAATVHLVSNQWGLATVAGMAIGGMGGGAGGWFGGFMQGAALGVSSPRLKSVRLYGGMVGGLMVVLVVSVRDVGIDWTQRGRWSELLEILLLAAATGAFGALTAGAAVGRFVRAFADRGDGRAGKHPLDD